MGRAFRTSAVVFGLIVLLCQSQAQARPGCYGALRKVIQTEIGLSCRYIDGKPVKIGVIHVGKSQFGIWYFFYRRLPDFAGGSAHGNTRLYIFKNGRFLGEYDPPQPHKMHIQGNTIVIDDNEEPGNTITLTADGPPKRVLIDGDFLDFTPR